jgi:hypothetical protein
MTDKYTRTNIHASSEIRTHDISVQVINTYTSVSAATGIGMIIMYGELEGVKKEAMTVFLKVCFVRFRERTRNTVNQNQLGSLRYCIVKVLTPFTIYFRTNYSLFSFFRIDVATSLLPPNARAQLYIRTAVPRLEGDSR